LGSGLNSYLRVFDAAGDQLLANDDSDGRDAGLTFQARADGTYFLGVSASGDDKYDAVKGTGDAPGPLTHGLYELTLTRTAAAGAPLSAALAGGSFTLDRPDAVPGETVNGSFRVENRGGAASGPLQVTFLLAPSQAFGAGAVAVGSPVSIGPVAADGSA